MVLKFCPPEVCLFLPAVGVMLCFCASTSKPLTFWGPPCTQTISNGPHCARSKNNVVLGQMFDDVEATVGKGFLHALPVFVLIQCAAMWQGKYQTIGIHLSSFAGGNFHQLYSNSSNSMTFYFATYRSGPKIDQICPCMSSHETISFVGYHF